MTYADICGPDLFSLIEKLDCNKHSTLLLFSVNNVMSHEKVKVENRLYKN